MGVKGYAIHLSFSPGNGVLMRDNTPKSTRTQGGDPIADYIRADTRLPAYLPYPRFLLKMEISQTAKLLYSLLLDRSTLSQKNKWLDDEGRIYIIYPIAEIAEILDKGSTTIKGALNELDTAGLDDLCALLSDREVLRYIEPPFSKEKTVQFLMDAGLSEKPLVYAVEDSSSFIGYVIFHDYDEENMEIGWILKRDVSVPAAATVLIFW